MTQLTLFLMNRKGLAVLEAIGTRLGGRAIRAVVGSRDHNVEKDHFDEIRDKAAELDVQHFERTIAPVPAADEICLAAGWRWLIHGTKHLVVLHDSLLPRYRGFAPVVSCLINGEPQIGVTAVVANAGYDEGDILAQAHVDVTYPITVAEAIERLRPLYAEVSLDLATRLVSGLALEGRVQDASQATYSLWRDDDDYRVDWSGSSARIRRFIDAVGHPYLGACALIEGRRARILEATECPELRIENRTPGKVIRMEEGLPVVVCGEGLLKIVRLTDDESGRSLLPLARFRTRFA